MSEFSATIVVVENENDQTITFCFGNSEELSQRVKFDRSILPSFANLIHSRIPAGSVTPISASSLFAGQKFRVTGIVPNWNQDGSIDVEIYLQLPDRGVTLPIHFAKSEAAAFLAALKVT